LVVIGSSDANSGTTAITETALDSLPEKKRSPHDGQLNDLKPVAKLRTIGAILVSAVPTLVSIGSFWHVVLNWPAGETVEPPTAMM
jgi:hypothetical protein